jgi:hypothetical protein
MAKLIGYKLKEFGKKEVFVALPERPIKFRIMIVDDITPTINITGRDMHLFGVRLRELYERRDWNRLPNEQNSIIGLA